MRCFLLEKMHGTITSKKCLPLANTEQSFEWYSKCKRWLYFSWETQNWRMFIKSSHRHRCYARSIVPIGATCLFHLLYVANDNLWPSASCFFFPPFGRAAIWGGRDVTVCFPLNMTHGTGIEARNLQNPEILLYPISSMYGIFTHIWLIFMVNVGKYTSPMDGMGMRVTSRFRHLESIFVFLTSIKSRICAAWHWKWCLPQHKSTYGSFLHYNYV